MTRIDKKLFLTFLLWSILFAFPSVRATNVLSGYDCFTVPLDGGSYYNFGLNPIPAGFFGPGSDPFDGNIVFGGQHIETNPPEALGPTDAVIRRLDAATFDSCGIPDPIPIEIVALNLVSVNPIRVTFFGGLFHTFWDVEMCLSANSQQQGTMTITHSCDAGGVFNTNLPVLPRFRFIKTDEPEFQEILDFGIEQLPAIVFEGGYAGWTHSGHGLNLLSSPGGIMVDHNCDGNIDMAVGPGSNFFAGVIGSPCDCDDEPLGYGIQTFYLQSGDQMARIGLIPAEGQMSIPTLSEWGMLILALLLLAMGTVGLIKQRKRAVVKAG